MKLKAPLNCPACGGEYEITTLTCKKCNSALCGHFSGCDFCNLNDDDSFFVLTFLKCRGNIRDVEKELGISYPTVRGRLDAIIKRLGLISSQSAEEIKEERKGIFERLEKGEITADQAAELLKSL
ncbi:MAG: DUF2089 domain-containing protein [Christensenellales bacterium]|jgi:hypothetical protein